MSRTLRDVVFVDGVRTPFGKAGPAGVYAETRADDLVVRCLRGLLERNPGLPRIAFGAYDVAVAGGVEHMGRHPMGEGVDPNPRLLSERIVDPSALVMGSTAENLHDRFPGISRVRCDAFAVASQEKVAKAYAEGRIQPDLVTVATRSVERGWGLATQDEPPRPGTTAQSLAGLKTPFRPHGSVTAGNAAGLNDGATACLVAAEEVADELGLTKKMRLVGYGFAGVAPETMGVGPIPSTERALARTGLTIDDIGLFELNEAFAVQVLAFLDHFGVDDEDPRVNPYGGAIALGHPLASSGVRLMTQLARQLGERPDVRYGLTAMCVGLGMGGTVICLVPGWGGTQLLPNLVGPEKAATVVLENALSSSRMLKGPQALELGIADVGFAPADFLEKSLAWAAAVVEGDVVVERPQVARGQAWQDAVATARRFVDAKVRGSAPAPYRALELLALAETASFEQGTARRFLPRGVASLPD